ncbi:MAG: class I tRNA ligase family protein, partial [Sedimentisphaerales bacterium]|nr:class I tRNA ligase family protein [Sedimentisphaerales bacterium]
QGRKMSKSLGNGIDPAEVIDSHGADAMRFALAQMTTLTQDVRMPIEPMTLPDGRTVNSSPKFDLGRNFCNKLWNASRFALGNLQDMPAGAFAPETLHLADRWILSRLHRTIADVGGYLEAYQFSEPMQALYKFFWNDLCDWYLEIIKPRLRRGRDRPATQRVLAYVLDAVLRLMHPFIPFITEEIFQMLNRIGRRRDLDGLVELPAAETCMQAPWPAANPDRIDEDADREMAVVQTIIRLIREIRTRYQVPPKNALEVTCKTTEGLCNLLGSQRDLLCHLANLRNFRAGRDCAKPDDAAVAVADELELYVHGVVDARAERAKLIMQQENLAGRLQSARAKLQNENFLQRAKPQIVQREQERLAQLEEQLATVRKNLEAFGATDAADPPGTA